MLELRPVCENCGVSLPDDSIDARICSYECTFCANCVDQILQNVCPNCSGGFVARPIRPKAQIAKHPAKTEPHIRPVDMQKHAERIARFASIEPSKR